MTYWVKARAAWLSPLASLAVVVACMVIGGISMPVPSLGVGAPIPFAVMLPIASAVALAASLERRDIELESAAVRRVNLYDLGLATVACSTGGTVALLAWLADRNEALVIAGRNIVGFTAVVLILARVVGIVAAPAILAVYVVLCAVAGGARHDHGPMWSWPVGLGGDVRALVIAVVLMGIAAILWTLSPPRRRFGMLSI